MAEEFNAEEWVNVLLKEGSAASCDETSTKFNENDALPEFYDKNLYERGRKFYYKNIFALFYGKILGLISILSIQSILNILMMTNMSGSPMTAYKRYMATVFHMCVWYDSNLEPESKMWQSIKMVKQKHSTASKKGITCGLQRISQKDMALTQCGFMGFALARREKIGLHNVTDEEWKGFIHIWRIVGALMGIEDRFNICRDSSRETMAICSVLLEKVFKPEIEKKDKDFIKMATNLIQGMWVMNPTLNSFLFLSRAYSLAQPEINLTNNNNETELQEIKPLFRLNWLGKFGIAVHIFVMWTLQFTIVRLFHNYVHILALWLMKVCPFLAYYKFGYSNSHVKIFTSSTDVKSD